MKKKFILGLFIILLFFLIIYFMRDASIPPRIKEMFKEEQITADSELESITNPQPNNSLILNKKGVIRDEENKNNNAPVIFDIPNINFGEGTSTTIELDNYVEEINNPNSEIIWTVSGNVNTIININPITHVAILSAPAGWNGAETITFKAINGIGLFDEDDVFVTVNSINN